jgi:hypothetical protein
MFFKTFPNWASIYIGEQFDIFVMFKKAAIHPNTVSDGGFSICLPKFDKIET